MSRSKVVATNEAKSMRSTLVPISLVLACAASALRAQAPPRPVPDSQTVVFVCEHGTVKSVVALAYFRQLAQRRQLPIRAISRGTAPDTSVPRLVRDGLRLDGLTLGPFTPTRFTAADLTSAIAVISFDQPSVASLVGARVPSARWDGLPAVSENYPVARDSIRDRVARLVDSLDRARRQRGRSKRPGH
jgi:protein-tyrosine-phosphatase